MSNAELIAKYSKPIYCNALKCMWNVKLEEKVFLKHHREHQPFDDDAYEGICSRNEIGLYYKEEAPTFGQVRVKKKWVYCPFRSDVHPSGHMDWSRFPQGGNIPDPMDPNEAYI